MSLAITFSQKCSLSLSGFLLKLSALFFQKEQNRVLSGLEKQENKSEEYLVKNRYIINSHRTGIK